jgi:transcriptional regulator with XRE-family HTH domain
MLLAHITDLCAMNFGTRLATLRKQRGFTQPALADAIDLHVSQLRRYEAGTSQPTLDVIRRLALTLNTSADVLNFDEAERTIPNDLAHHLEAISQLDPDEQAGIRALIEGALLRHQARKLAG